MNRSYSTGNATNITYFVGKEIEKTPAYGMTTLFVTGIRDPEEIIQLAKDNGCQHIYIGANQSFDPEGYPSVHQSWDDMLLVLLCDPGNFWVTLDFDVQYVSWVHEYGAAEKRRFIPQISVKIPHLTLFNYNATIKIDDIDFCASNPGVWVHPLRSLLTESQFTNWDLYGKDKIIK